MAILSGSNRGLSEVTVGGTGKFRFKKRVTAVFGAMPRRRRVRSLRKEPWSFGGVWLGCLAFASDPYRRIVGFGLILSLNVLPVVLFTKCSRPQPGHVTAS